MKYKGFLNPHRQQWNYRFQDPESSKDIVKIVHISGSIVIYEAMRMLFVHKENKNNNFI